MASGIAATGRRLPNCTVFAALTMRPDRAGSALIVRAIWSVVVVSSWARRMTASATPFGEGNRPLALSSSNRDFSLMLIESCRTARHFGTKADARLEHRLPAAELEPSPRRRCRCDWRPARNVRQPRITAIRAGYLRPPESRRGLQRVPSRAGLRIAAMQHDTHNFCG